MHNPPARERSFRPDVDDIFYIFMAFFLLYAGGWRALLHVRSFSFFILEMVAGIIISVVLFFFGLALTNLSISTAMEKFKGSLRAPYPYYPSFISKLWPVPLEELFWRASLMPLCPAKEPFFIFISLGFSLSHFKLRLNPLNILKYLDLFCLSMILCYLYAYTDNIYLVILIHALRNILVTLNFHYTNRIKRMKTG